MIIIKNKNIIGNPKRKRFSFGYTSFFGEFGLIDLGISLFFISIIIVNFIFSKFIIALVTSLFLIVFWILLIKQFGNEKSYDFIISFLAYHFSYKKIKNEVLIMDSKEVVFKVKNGFNLELFEIKEIDELLEKFNHFIKLYDGQFKIMKYNSGFQSQKNCDFIYDIYLNEKVLKKQQLQEIFYEYSSDLAELEFNNEIFFILKNPNKTQLSFIKNIDLGFSLEMVDNKEFDQIKSSLFKEAEVKTSKIIGEKEFIVSKAKFKRNVNFGWLINLFNSSQVSFILEVDSLNFDQQQKVIKRLNKQKLNYKTNNEIEEVEKEYLVEANKEVMADIILSKEELKMIDLTTIFVKDDTEIPLINQYKIFEKNNYYCSGFKLIKEYFNQKNALKNAFEWNNGIYPTTNETISNSYPFGNQSYIESEGFFLGTIDDRYPFIYDSWSRKNKSNWHTILLGSSGSGKTTLMKYIIAGEIATHKGRHIIIDPHDEFRIFAENFNGIVYKLNKIKLNPLKFVGVTEKNFYEQIQKKILSLKEMFHLIYKNELNPDFNQQLQKILILLEEELTNRKEEIMNNYEFKFSDLSISEEEIFAPIIHGVYKMFNEYEELDFNYKIMVLEAKELFLMEEEFKNTIIFLIMNRINEEIFANQNGGKLNFYLDEAGKFLRNDFLIKKLSPLFSEARKFNTKITIATQNLTDLYNGKSIDVNLSNIFSNASNLFIGYLKNDQIDLLNDFVSSGRGREITDVEHKHMNKKLGHFLYLSDENRYCIISFYDEVINEIIGIKS